MDKELEKRRKSILDLTNSANDTDVDTYGLSEKEIEELNQITMEMPGISEADPDSETISETIYDYIDLAYSARSRKKRIEYVEKALQLDPENIDALLAKAIVTSKLPEDELAAISEVVNKAKKALESEGYFKDSCGLFWGILETRPYMRARALYCNRLIRSGKLRLAEKEAKDMLVLSENDNLGMRFALAYIYMHLEDKDGMEKLLADYPENVHSTDFLLTLAALYYKLGDLQTSAGYLSELTRLNNDAKDFIKHCASEFDSFILYGAHSEPFEMVRCYSIDELLNALVEYNCTFTTLESFFKWAVTATKSTRKKKPQAKE